LAQKPPGHEQRSSLDQRQPGTDLGFRIEGSHALAQPTHQQLGPLLGHMGRQAGSLTSGVLVFELCVLARPVVDLPLHAGLDLLARLFDPLQPFPLDLLQVLGHQGLHRVGQYQLVPVLVQPASPQQRLDQLQLSRAQGRR